MKLFCLVDELWLWLLQLLLVSQRELKQILVRRNLWLLRPDLRLNVDILLLLMLLLLLVVVVVVVATS